MKRNPADTYVRTLLKCKQTCQNAPHDHDPNPNYKLCRDGLPAKLRAFFQTVGIGEDPQRILTKCDDILKRTGGFMQQLEGIVDKAVKEAHNDWQNVGKEVDDLEKYDAISAFRSKEMIKESIWTKSKLGPEHKLWNAKIVSLRHQQQRGQI
jgi:hypothetical protein